MEARFLQIELEALHKDDCVFLDSDDLRDLSKLVDHVQQSRCLVLVQTRNVLARPYCILELLTAIESQIPIVCVMLQFLSEAMRYAIVFSHGDASSEYFFNTFAFWYVEGRWAMLAGAMFGVFFLTLVLKVVLGFALLGVARRMLEGPADDVQKDTGAKTAPLRL